MVASYDSTKSSDSRCDGNLFSTDFVTYEFARCSKEHPDMGIDDEKVSFFGFFRENRFQRCDYDLNVHFTVDFFSLMKLDFFEKKYC